MAGEERIAKLLYLAVTSRLLQTGRSASSLKGPSSGGQEPPVGGRAHLLPESAYYALTAMSERTLAYSTEPIRHRFLVIYEAAGMSGEFATYLMRSLLSEGRVRYETVEKTSEGMKPRLIEREGPTGLIVTTTAVKLHPENETRLLSLTVTDTQEQTRAVMAALAEEAREHAPDLVGWHALQIWLESAEHRVSIPYAGKLAELIPPVAVRLRRDFGALLNLIRAHAILHHATRERDADGRIVATIEDYAAVRKLVADLVSEGIEATVPKTVRETVEAVKGLREELEGRAGHRGRARPKAEAGPLGGLEEGRETRKIAATSRTWKTTHESLQGWFWATIYRRTSRYYPYRKKCVRACRSVHRPMHALTEHGNRKVTRNIWKMHTKRATVRACRRG